MKKVSAVVASVVIAGSVFARDYQTTSASRNWIDLDLTVPVIDFVPGMPSHITMEIRIHRFAERLPKLNSLTWYFTDIGGGPWIIYGICTAFSLDDPEYNAATDTWTKVIQQDVFIYWYVPECPETQVYGFTILRIAGYGYRVTTEFMTVTFIKDITPPQTLITAPEPGICDPDVTFEFAALDDYSKNDDFRYYCKLEPIETTYKYQGYLYSRSYSDLEVGDYTFYVYARDLSHNIDQSPATLVITVQEPDITPPTILLTSPYDQQSDVEPTTDIIIAFSEPMNQAMTETALSFVPSIPDGFMWNTELIYIPSGLLIEETEYTAMINTVACDIAGNPLQEPYVFSFSVGDYTPPDDVASLVAEPSESSVELSWVNPINELAGIAVFRKEGEPVFIPTRGEAYVVDNNYEDVLCVCIGMAEGFVDSGLQPNVTYTYAVFAFDEIPNYSAGVTASAMTIGIAPEIVSVCPKDSAVLVSRTADISVEFSQPMNRLNTEQAFSIEPTVRGEFCWSNDCALVFTPKQKFKPSEMYTVVITTEATDEFGIHLVEPYSFSFTVRHAEAILQDLRDYIPDEGCGVVAPVSLAILLLLATRKRKGGF